MGDGARASRDIDLTLEELPGTYAIVRLEPGADLPAWACDKTLDGPGLVSISRSDQELSIVAPQSIVPDDEALRVEPDWIAFRVTGTLDFNLVGILARLTSVLADARVPAFATSTFDTDYLLVRQHDAEKARGALGQTMRI